MAQEQYDTAAWNKQLNSHLEEIDPEMFDIIEHEKQRQFRGLQLIASENFTSQAVLDCLGSVMQNKYSEGLPGKRYYGGNEFIDKSERLCQTRALKAFRANPEEWGVNVQCLSGSPANFIVYTALLKPHDRILALDLPHGGHLSHGYQTPSRKISAVSIYFETLPYRLNEQTGLIDYDKVEELAELYRPKLIVAGTSAYSRLLDYKRFREICDKVGAVLMADMAHISGLVAAGVIPSPFEYADIVTTTTHKSLRGPRGAMIFFRKGSRVTAAGKKIEYDYEDKINSTVFPGHQGGPHNHTISALAVALKLADTKEYVEYQTQVIKNAKALAGKLSALGYNIVSGGTDNHLLLVDMRSQGIDGARAEKFLDLVGIVCNKNTVPGDKSALIPGGIRLGSPALTSRGFVEKDFEKIAEYIDRAVKVARQAQQDCQAKKFAEFEQYLVANLEKYGVQQLKDEVETYSVQFPAVGFDVNSMKYKPKALQQ